MKLGEPLVRFELEDAAAWCLDWANSEVIAVGCSNGESPCSGRTLTMRIY